jgi:hypothetical protein
MLIFAAAGCGGSASGPVSGRVTLNGQPLANARVSFQPIEGDPFKLPPGSVGDTDADGRYTLRVIGGQGATGAVVGKHRVTISVISRPSTSTEEVLTKPSNESKGNVPARYNSEEGGLTFTVPLGGTDAANFELTSP